MRIIYLAPFNFPRKTSHAIQIVHTCHALARQGARVELTVKKIGTSAEEILDQYGLRPHDNLWFGVLSEKNRKIRRWSGKTFGMYMRYQMAKNRLKGRSFYYCRGTRKTLNMLRQLKGFGRLLGVPMIYEMHAINYLDIGDRHGNRFGTGAKLTEFLVRVRQLEDEVYHGMAGLVTISDGLRELIIEHFNVQCPILVAPSGVLLADGEPPRLEERDTDICYVGSLYEFNGLEVLIEAMAHLPGRRLRVVGGGEQDDLERLREIARRVQVSDRVEFTGHVPHRDARAALDRSRVVAAPLLQGSFDRVERYCSPAKLMEYMASGAVVVASRLPSVQEILKHEENAILVTPNSPEELAKGLRQGLEDTETAERLRARALEDVKHYRFEVRAERILEFLGQFGGG